MPQDKSNKEEEVLVVFRLINQWNKLLSVFFFSIHDKAKKEKKEKKRFFFFF